MTTYLETEIEAQDRDNAWDIALNMEGDAFTEILHSGDWKIMDVIEKSEVQK